MAVDGFCWGVEKGFVRFGFMGAAKELFPLLNAAASISSTVGAGAEGLIAIGEAAENAAMRNTIWSNLGDLGTQT